MKEPKSPPNREIWVHESLVERVHRNPVTLVTHTFRYAALKYLMPT
jgi:hypothetical protein